MHLSTDQQREEPHAYRRDPRRGLSVSTKISIGFSIVLVLHISIAILSHLGLEKGKRDLDQYNTIHLQVERFDEIDRAVGALQRNVLLFAFTGYEGPSGRAAELQDQLDNLLDEADLNATNDVDRQIIKEMKKRLSVHREIFAAVVTDRDRRRKLVNDTLKTLEEQIHQSIVALQQRLLSKHLGTELETQFTAAELGVMRFISGPDSFHVRSAKQSLANARNVLSQIAASDSGETQTIARAMSDEMSQYEAAMIQMVQTTRGYLHLVNVVLAGESVEFRRLATNIRKEQSQLVMDLAEEMAQDTRRFQDASSVFSVITIILGIIASWLIGRDVAPPLNAIAQTFDDLASGKDSATIPALDRGDELGRLASAAQVFQEQATETKRLLQVATSSREELNEVNQRLESQTSLAEQMAQEALSATVAKSEFLANMSHEIRTPMTAILGFAEAMAESSTDPQTLRSIETIRRNGEHLLAIINDILDLSKIEAGKMTVEKRKVDPCRLIQESMDLVKVKADAAGLPIHLEFEGAVPQTIQTDTTRFRQILINLLGNAIKFTEKGHILVSVAGYEGADNPVFQIDIVDTGVGMSPDRISRLFQEFSQADNSTTRKFGGTGLGLSISKRFAALLGGDLILVESEPGVGSRFRLTVDPGSLEGVAITENPSCALPSNADKGPADVANIDLSGYRILLAEDGPDNQRLISFLLRKTGAEVDVVENGQLAVDKALQARDQGIPFDCILMDMQMPVMGGYEATQCLRDQHYHNPVIALTAHAMGGDREKCLSAGCDDYLTKPINRSSFLATVARWSQAEQLGRTPSGNDGDTPQQHAQSS